MNLFSNLFLFSSIHGGFIILVILFQNKRKFNENVFLIALLTIITGYVLREYVYLLGHFETFPHLMAVFVPFLYLIGPCYYFYVKTSIANEVSFKRKDIWHILPALICFLTILPFYAKSGSEKLALFSAPAPGHLELNTNRIFYYGFMLLSWFYYAWKSFGLIKKKMEVFDGRTLKPVSARLNWLKNYTIVFLLFLFIFLVAQLIFVFSDFHPYYVMLSTVLASSFLIHFVGYWALRESRITNSINHKAEELLIPASRAREIKEQILQLLEDEKVYTNGELSINDFSQRLSINTKYLSQLINAEFNCSMTSLINSYRVNASKELIMNEDYGHLNFLGIANKVGFNTKNTFTRAFKRHTGMTPSQFKMRRN